MQPRIQDQSVFGQMIQAFGNDDADTVSHLLQAHPWLAAQIGLDD